MIVEQSPTDFMYTTNQHGLSLLKFKNHPCMTVFENKEFQVFYTEECNAVYNKIKEQVFSLTEDAWTKLVLKLESYVTYSVNKPLHTDPSKITYGYYNKNVL